MLRPPRWELHLRRQGLQREAQGNQRCLAARKSARRPFPPGRYRANWKKEALIETLRSGKWYRGAGQHAKKFEEAYQTLTGAKHCLATANGTSALYVSLNAIGVEPGDEVIVPPYTFIATVNVVLRQHALPVFVDTDVNTFQIDAKKVEAAISPRTKAMIPVHLGGAAFDVDAILSVSRKHDIPVIEDACQSHLAEWRGRKVGTYGRHRMLQFSGIEEPEFR